MRANGLTTAAVVAAAPGGVVTGATYDLISSPSGLTATLREDGRTGVRLPRNCYALPGERVTYSVQRRGAARVAVESQIAVCDGAAPPQPWTPSGPSIPSAPLAIGATSGAGGNF